MIVWTVGRGCRECADDSRLDAREWLILAYLAAGVGANDIAASFGMTPREVERHRAAGYANLTAQNPDRATPTEG